MYPPCRAAPEKRRVSSIYHYIRGYREKQILSFPSAEGERFRRSGGLPPQAMSAPLLLPSAEGKRFRRYSGSPLEARFTPSEGVRRSRLRRQGVSVPTDRGKRGKGHRWFPFPPLDSPNLSFKPRRPSVARLNARGPQMCLVLQGTALDRSGAFRSDGANALHRMAAHCYARRATQSRFRA